MRVLLIEDDSSTAQSIELMLKADSFSVYTTDLGEEGVDLAKVYDYDLILLDLNLPGKDGVEVCRELRARYQPSPGVVMVTARGTDADLVVGAPGDGWRVAGRSSGGEFSCSIDRDGRVRNVQVGDHSN